MSRLYRTFEASICFAMRSRTEDALFPSLLGRVSPTVHKATYYLYVQAYRQVQHDKKSEDYLFLVFATYLERIGRSCHGSPPKTNQPHGLSVLSAQAKDSHICHREHLCGQRNSIPFLSPANRRLNASVVPFPRHRH